MGKKKKFINKKKATTFHLVQRTQNDPTYKDGESQYMLQPLYTRENQGSPHIPEGFPTELLQYAEDGEQEPMHPLEWLAAEQGKQPGELGHDYDYSKHLRTIGGGTVLENSAFSDNFPQELRNQESKVMEQDIPELVEQSDFDMPMKPEEVENGESLPGVIATRDFFEVLQDEGEEGEFEEVLDDFVFSAMQDPTDDQKRELEAMARQYEHDDDDEDYEGDEGDEGDEVDLEELDRKEKAAFQKTAIDDEFDHLLKEYEDEDIGSLDPDEDEEVLGYVEDVGKAYEAELDQFARRKEDNDYRPGVEPGKEPEDVKLGESVRNHLDNQIRAWKDEDDDMKSVHSRIDHDFAPVAKEKWDCESIISTYSNLENHPKIIPTVRRSSSQKIIQISKKTGIPLGYYPTREKAATNAIAEEDDDDGEGDEDDDESTISKDNLGERRSKAETKAEKKARKAQVKASRRERRAEKKGMKLMYTQESSKLQKTMVKMQVANPNVKHMD